jgi:3-polyprenyl-4-hydroxybenzoate decarboxylase
VDHFVFRILDHLGIPHAGSTRWKGLAESQLAPIEAIDE